MDRRRMQQGSMAMGPPLFALAVGAIVVFAQWPGERTWLAYAGLAAFLAFLAWLAARTGALPGLESAGRRALAQHVQTTVNGQFSTQEVPVWGGRTMPEYVVAWVGDAGAMQCRVGVSNVTLTLCQAAGDRPEAYVTFTSDGSRYVRGSAAEMPWIDDQDLRRGIEAVLSIAGTSGIALSVDAKSIGLSTQDVDTREGIAQLVERGMPVLAQAGRLAATRSTGVARTPVDQSAVRQRP